MSNPCSEPVLRRCSSIKTLRNLAMPASVCDAITSWFGFARPSEETATASPPQMSFAPLLPKRCHLRRVLSLGVPSGSASQPSIGCTAMRLSILMPPRSRGQRRGELPSCWTSRSQGMSNRSERRCSLKLAGSFTPPIRRMGSVLICTLPTCFRAWIWQCQGCNSAQDRNAAQESTNHNIASTKITDSIQGPRRHGFSHSSGGNDHSHQSAQNFQAEDFHGHQRENHVVAAEGDSEHRGVTQHDNMIVPHKQAGSGNRDQ